ncbi:hypothetical protein GDO86_013980 [Hymenochirus boettgeri]|uniref:Uncharacterized protein n=1 Tax=Hymenochirus boettgeri TaxID=247094 RepID=A0A8T2JMB8_9PIPI|nr:hypothetical protein GDO86_013980 [Hymenochirus boettgeri]
MAGRKAALRAIDWMAFAERVPPNQKAMLMLLRHAATQWLQTIDWAFYRTAVQKAGMVEEFEKKAKQAASYLQESKVRVSQYEKEVVNLAEHIIAKKKAAIKILQKPLPTYQKMGFKFIFAFDFFDHDLIRYYYFLELSLR